MAVENSPGTYDVVGQLLQDSEVSAPLSRSRSDARSQRGLERFQEFPVTLTVRIGAVDHNLKEWLEVGIGTRISLEESWREPVHLLINDRPVGRGVIVLVGNRFGVRVTEWIMDEQ